MALGRGGFPRWFDRLLSVGGGCVAGFVVLMFLPGLVAWAVSGGAELGRSLTRVLAGWGFGPVAVLCGLCWFALPYWGGPFGLDAWGLGSLRPAPGSGRGCGLLMARWLGGRARGRA